MTCFYSWRNRSTAFQQYSWSKPLTVLTFQQIEDFIKSTEWQLFLFQSSRQVLIGRNLSIKCWMLEACFLGLLCNCIGTRCRWTIPATGCGFNYQALLVDVAFPFGLCVIGHANWHDNTTSGAYGGENKQVSLKTQGACPVSCMNSQ